MMTERNHPLANLLHRHGCETTVLEAKSEYVAFVLEGQQYVATEQDLNGQPAVSVHLFHPESFETSMQLYDAETTARRLTRKFGLVRVIVLEDFVAFTAVANTSFLENWANFLSLLEILRQTRDAFGLNLCARELDRCFADSDILGVRRTGKA